MGLLKFLLILTSGAFFVAVVVIALSVFLIVTGSPSTCAEPGWSVFPDPLLATQLDARWSVFSDQAKAGPATIEVSEAEATARGRRYLDEKDVPVDNLNVYFCGDGKGQLAGKVGALGIGVKFVVTGHLDVSGEKPVVELDSVDLGNMPGFVADAVLHVLLNDQARTLEIDDHLTATEISQGKIVISGGP